MMPLFLNLLLAILWAAASGSFAFGDLALGYAVGFAVFVVFRRQVGAGAYVSRVAACLSLFTVFVRELFASNLKVAWEVITPRHHMRPAVVAVPISACSDLELVLLASMITLTPGNLVIEVSADRRTLFLHAMYADDPEDVRWSIKQGFERAVLRLSRLEQT